MQYSKYTIYVINCLEVDIRILEKNLTDLDSKSENYKCLSIMLMAFQELMQQLLQDIHKSTIKQSEG